jgi:hypothetical protein
MTTWTPDLTSYPTHEVIVFADATNKVRGSDRTNRKAVNVTCNNA